jgi:hypothetical protein
MHLLQKYFDYVFYELSNTILSIDIGCCLSNITCIRIMSMYVHLQTITLHFEHTYFTVKTTCTAHLTNRHHYSIQLDWLERINIQLPAILLTLLLLFMVIYRLFVHPKVQSMYKVTNKVINIQYQHTTQNTSHFRDKPHPSLTMYLQRVVNYKYTGP